MAAKYAQLTKSNATGQSDSECSGQGREGVAFAQIAPYGVISKAPSGSIVILLPVNDNESDVVGIADSLNKGSLPTPEEGEIVIGNYLSGCFIHFKNNGEIDIKGKVNQLEGDFETLGKVTAQDLETPVVNFNDHVHPENGTITGTPQ
ncbi:hypothetical protein [Neisseria sp. Ec49-e6-T10]|uniref:hypothetical protein n=1 Tax=Neisseria sp. Ec49-e6-T10 TaxID=3140744 RepID=UPI003EBA5F57